MKRIIKYILLTILCLGLTNCSNTEKPNEELEVDYFSIDYICNSDITITDNYENNEYFKCLEYFSEVKICNKDTNNESVEIDYSDYNVNFDSLIGGDALKISYYGKWIGTSMLPGRLHFNATIESIEVINAGIYEVVVHNDGESVTFAFKDDNVEIDETKLNAEQLIFNNNGIATEITTSLEDGAILYYSYNTEHPSSSTYLYSYNPRGE